MGGGNLIIQLLCGSFISRGARGQGPYAASMDAGGGMPRQTLLTLVCFPLLVLVFTSSTSGCLCPWAIPGKEESSAPGSLLGWSAGKCESSPTSAHPKYPSIPRDNPEPPHGKPQSSPVCDTAHFPSAQAARGCALLGKALLC